MVGRLLHHHVARLELHLALVDKGTKSRLVASWHKKRLIPARSSGPVHAGYANSSIAFDRPNGSSVAIGHPWSATGGRILTTAANELARRDGRYALISICAAGAMAGAFLLSRR